MAWILANWRLILLSLLAVGAFSFGVYLQSVWEEYQDLKAEKEHNEWYLKNSTDLEKEKTKNRTNERKVVYASKNLGNDCLVTAERLRVLNAALTNDTSQLDQ